VYKNEEMASLVNIYRNYTFFITVNWIDCDV